MSYLNVADLPEFKKCVISFWFRVPQESVDAAKKASDDALAGGTSAPFNGTVPLVVMGKPGKGATPTTTKKNYSVPVMNISSTICSQGGVRTSPPTGCGGPYDVQIGNVTWHCCETFEYNINYFCDCSGTDTYTENTLPEQFGIPGTTVTSIDGDAAVTDPTFIGFDGNLYINIESNKKPSVTGDMERSSIGLGQETGMDANGCSNGDAGESIPCLGCLCMGLILPGIGTSWDNRVPMDSSYSMTPPTYNYTPVPGDPATGNISGYLGSPTTGGPPGTDTSTLAADTWHHVLISIELNKMSTHGIPKDDSATYPPTVGQVDSSCKIYVAVDDKNYIQDNLPGDWVDGGGDNDVIGSDAFRTTRSSPQEMVQGDGTTVLGPMPTYSVDMSVPAGDLGMPATVEFVNDIYRVELAEFIMWIDVSHDTASEEFRRLFISAPGKDGKQGPVNQSPSYIPFFKYAVGDPTTWVPAADTPAFVPPLSSMDPSLVGSGNKTLGTPDIDFTKCSFNWMMGRNLGTLKGAVTHKGQIKEYTPDPSIGGGNGGTPAPGP